MKMEFLPSILVLLAFFSVGDATRKVGDEEFPFQVSIKTQDNRHLCGGAIITPKWVLTVMSCLRNQPFVRVSYGSADSNDPLGTIASKRIEKQSGFPLNKKNRLALIELESRIEISKTAKPAGLPTASVELRNTTKVAGWKLTQSADVPPDLYASDVYFVIPKDCKTRTGSPVHLDTDEFCGMDEEETFHLFSPGSTVSKAAIVLGILSEGPLTMHQPYVYVKVSEHEEWIRDTLGPDAEQVHWVNDVPKDSASISAGVSLAVIGISAIFIRFI